MIRPAWDGVLFGLAICAFSTEMTPLDGMTPQVIDTLLRLGDALPAGSSWRGGCTVNRDEATEISVGRIRLTRMERFWRNRLFARARHKMTVLRRSSTLLTRGHAFAIRCSGGRIRRSFLFTGGMPVLVLTTVGRKTGKKRSTPLGYLRVGESFAVVAANAGSDRVPAWWLNLQADQVADVFLDRRHHTVHARAASPVEDESLWKTFKALNPGFDEYRSLTERRLPVVLLEVRSESTEPG
jgi:deazaflavin-dependent oxidoreductase (nitroreductase family)